MGLIAGLVFGLLVRPPDMARRAGLLLLPLGLIGALAWGAELRDVAGEREAAALAALVAGWLAMGIGGLLLWRAKERVAKAVLVAGVILLAAAPLISIRAEAHYMYLAVLVLTAPPLLLLACALAIPLRREPGADSMSGRPAS